LIDETGVLGRSAVEGDWKHGLAVVEATAVRAEELTLREVEISRSGRELRTTLRLEARVAGGAVRSLEADAIARRREVRACRATIR
jgi:hypothetical protein